MDKAISNPTGLRPFGRVHIVGIGGIGMSGIAEVMHVMGYEVQGSDLGDNANTNRLRDMGMKVVVGHAAENICLLYTSPSPRDKRQSRMPSSA